MSELTERLIGMRDSLRNVNTDTITNREYDALEADRDTLAEAANRIVELESTLLRIQKAWHQLEVK